MTDDNRPGVTVLGLGAMGTALAEAFLTDGHPTTVWNRSPGKTGDLVARGAIAADTVADAVSASPLVIVCVVDYAAVHAVLDPVGDTLGGRVLVNLTNGTPEQARATARWAAEHGADYLDGGIMAIPPGIATSQAFLLYSGSPDAYERHRTTLDLLGTGHYLGADVGLAPLYDIALLCAMYGMFAGALQAFALVGTVEEPAGDTSRPKAGGEARGRTTAQEFTSLLIPWLTAMAGGLPRMAEEADAGDYATGVVSTLAMQAAAFPNVTRAAQAQGVGTDLLRELQNLMDRRVADGHGAESITGVLELLKNR